MASAPQPQLPLFYNALEPLSSEAHAAFRLRAADAAPFFASQHAVPITTDEFVPAQRRLPIVFTQGDDAIPIVLTGLNEGINVFVDDDGKLTDPNVYVPAYVRRYPFMLARLRPEAEELSLCFDPTADTIGAFDDGEALFAEGQPSEVTRQILQFNEMFEQAGLRTNNFMTELRELGLLMDGETSITTQEGAPPFVYRGFQIINEEKLAELRGDQLRKIHKSGMLPLIYAHLFSLSVMPEIFNRQMALGKMPQPELTV